MMNKILYFFNADTFIGYSVPIEREPNFENILQNAIDVVKKSEEDIGVNYYKVIDSDNAKTTFMIKISNLEYISFLFFGVVSLTIFLNFTKVGALVFLFISIVYKLAITKSFKGVIVSYLRYIIDKKVENYNFSDIESYDYTKPKFDAYKRF